MWGDPDPDPGGHQKNAKPSSLELNELRDQNEQQLVLIAQLKEMLRKEQSTVTQEKVEEYVNTLNKVKAKRSKQKKDDSGLSSKASTSSASIDVNKKERINLLRQQLEENKARLAERGKSQKGIEEMVTQFQAQLKDSQSFINSAPLNVSLQEPKSFDYNENTPQKDLYNILLTKERKITELYNKSQKLEGTILDLQENLKEKDSVIDARTKAITLMTDNLSNKRKTTLDALEETKEQMRKMQENFISLESEMKNRQLTLLNDLKLKNFEISDLKEMVHQLETEKFELGKTIEGIESDKVTKSSKNTNLLELEALQTSLRDVETKNQILLEKISELETPINSASEEHYQKTVEENENNLLRISELQKQLKDLTESNKDLLHEKLEVNSKKPDDYKLVNENERLVQENSNNILRIEELEKKLEEAISDLNLLKSTGLGAGGHINLDENNEIAKLKKQLEESNKNMIKMRAMQKGKIKELNKKLDQFKKMSDANALIGQLQNEVTKLNEKIAELEDEKGNLQLKMIESTGSSKGSNDPEDHIRELTDKLLETTQVLEDKSKVIEILETEIVSLKAELKQKNEEQVKVSSHVSSEMSFIQYEEQIENLEADNKQLIEQLEELKTEKEDLLENIVVLKKEKQDVLSKLDNYIQENMELIDKLEKLSAEKVSSVESIEIVEGLTQQEKLELAAYQKHINPEESEKIPEEESLESPAELNESVLQLSEDTVELLRKIEMFTQERKEVMQKMESLKRDNESLHLKLKEIENNRDLLEETYEQLQNEKETLISEKEQLLQQLEDLSETDKSIHNEEKSTELLETKLKELQDQYEILIKENSEMKNKIIDLTSEINAKEQLEHKLHMISEEHVSLQEKNNRYYDEISALKVIIEENKNDLINFSDKVNKLHLIADEKDQEIGELNRNIQYLNDVINDLQIKNSNYEQMESELQTLNATLSEQVTNAAEYERGISANTDVIEKLNKELTELHQRILEAENDLEFQCGENKELKNELDNKEETIKCLQNILAEKDVKFKAVNEEMKGKYLILQQQLETNGISLQRQLDQLSGKNRDQMEKMKKLAANLKKKSQSYQELEEKYNNEKTEWETTLKNSIQESEDRITALIKEIKDIENQLRSKIEINTTINNEIDLLKHHIEDLEQTNADQQNYIFELKQRQEKLSQVSLQQELSQSLHEDIDNSFPQNISEEKIKELEMLLETKESEMYNYQQRIEKFEDTARMLQEEKSVLEIRNSDLLEKLEIASNTCNEKTLLENQWSQQLKELTANNIILSKQLEEANRKLEDNLKKNNENEDVIKRLKIKLKKAHDKVNELKTLHSNAQELEILNEKLKNQVSSLEAHQKHIQNENESLQKKNLSDYDKIEADYQGQLEELLRIKNDLSVENQKLAEQVKELESREQELSIELDDCKSKILQDQRNYDDLVIKLENEIKLVKENLETSESNGNRLQVELKETSDKLENCFIDIEDLNKTVTELRSQLTYCNKIKEDQELVLAEKQHINTQLLEANERVSITLIEKDNIEQQLSITNVELNSLRNEIVRLKEDIQALEFAKFSLEASCESAHKQDEAKSNEPVEPLVLEQPIVKKIKSNESAVMFHWPERNEPQLLASHLFDQLSETNTVFDNLTYVTSESHGTPVNQQIVEQPQDPNIPWPDTMDVKSDSEPKYSPIIENSRESLLKKIKALEFLLFNVDKEKEIALEQCTNMVNELAQLICQTSNSQQHETPVVIDESQILSDSQVDCLKSDKNAMRNIEYRPVKVDSCVSTVPVDEGLIQPKQAYLCFDDEDELYIKKEKDKLSSVESEIMSKKDVTDAAANIKGLQKLEYEQVTKSLGQQYQPVVEPLAQPKQSYLCYTKDDKPQSLDVFEENDDGWGWGPEEAKLDEAYMNSIENIPQIKALLLETQQLKEHIKVLQVERENHLEEIKQLQVKSGKLIKKCKELKQKSDQVSTVRKQDDGGFFDLNETIQEELKSQIQEHEKKIKDISTELEKEKNEKKAMLKKIDILTSANERMVEMKEIQDSEVLRWQRKYKEIEEKLLEVEWNTNTFEKEVKTIPECNKPVVEQGGQVNKIQELENTIKELSLDNEELQSLLEEQTNLRIEAEISKGKNNDPEEVRKLNETLHKELAEEKLKLSEVHFKLQEVQKQNEKLKEEVSKLMKVIENKEAQIKEYQNTADKIQHDNEEKMLNNLQNELVALKSQLRSQNDLLQEKDHDITILNNDLEHYNLHKVELDQSIRQLNNDLMLKSQEIDSLKLYINQTNQNTEDFQTQLNHWNENIRDKEQTILELNKLVDIYKSEKVALEESQSQLNERLNLKNEELENLVIENENILTDLHRKTVELENVQKTIFDLQKRIQEIELLGSGETEKLQAKYDDLQQREIEIVAQKLKLTDEVNLKTKQIEELTSENLRKDQEIHQLSKELGNKDSEFEERTKTLVNELNENWQSQVDQRGVDVAESWKSHLEIIEKDYLVVQQTMNSKIAEFEEKCNALLNENNALKKNLDKDNSTEVDTITSLNREHQVNQQTIHSLNLVINENEKKIKDLQNKLSHFTVIQNELDEVKNQNIEKDSKIESMNIIVETTQRQFDEKREVVEEIVSLLEKNATTPISYEKQDILAEFQRQLNLGIEKDIEIQKLTQNVSNLDNNLIKISGEKDRQITGLNQVIEDLEKELSVIHEKESEINKLSTELNNFQEEKRELRKNIKLLQEEKDGLLVNLEIQNQEHSNCHVVLESYNQKIEEYQNMYSSLQNALEEKERVITELNQQLLQIEEDAKNDTNKDIHTLTTNITKINEEYNTLQKSASEYQTQLNATTQKLAEKSHELEIAQQNIQYYQYNYNAYEEEINKLKQTLEQREQEYTHSLELLKNSQLADIQRHYDELLSNKHIDNQMLQAQVQELLNANKEYNERLSQEISSKQEVEQKLTEQTQIVDEDTKQLEELKLIIEDQVAKIDELKKELFDKSNQYDSLIAEMDLSRQPVTQQPSLTVSKGLDLENSKPHYEDDLSEPVSRAKLDFALYVIHQRDVRCEELTFELTHLLEERDTLQLKLSNAIKEKEELRKLIKDNTPNNPEQTSSTSGSKSSKILLAASGTELAKEPLDSGEHLESKLSQLRNIVYKKDKTFVDDQTARRLQQIAIMEQHINDASKLPPEAAAKLVDASYTLSRDVQSPSKVLLNWLWGKSPPKANDS